MDENEYKSLIKGKSTREKSSHANAFYALFSHISDHMIVKSAFVFVFLMFIETFHLLYLPVETLPNQNSSLKVFIKVLIWINYPRGIVLINTYMSWVGFIVLWMVHATFVTCVALCMVALLIFSKKSARRGSRLVVYLSGFASLGIVLFQTILLLPQMEIFLYPMLCSNGKNMIQKEETMPILFECGTSSQIIFSILGVIMFLETSAIFFLSSFILLEDYFYSPLPWAGETREMFVLQAVAKYATYLYITLDVNYLYLEYALLAAMVFYCLILYETVWTTRFICNKSVLFGYTLQASILFLSHAYSSAHLVYDSESTLLTVAMVIILGVVTGIFMYINNETKRQSLLFKDHTQLKLMKNAEEYVQSLCYTAISGRKTPFWKTVFRNVLRIHYQECTDESCLCKKLIGHSENESDTSHSLKKMNGKSETMSLVEIVMENEAAKWKQSRKIMLEVCYFQTAVMKNYFKAYYWVMSSEGLRGGLSELFLQYRMKHVLAQNIVMKESKNQGTDQIKVMIKFQGCCSSLQKMLEFTTNAISAFWKLFESPRLNVNELFSMAQKISVMLKLVSELFKKCNELSPNYPYIYYYYGHFVRLVLNNGEEAQDYIEKGDEIFMQMHENKYKTHEDISKAPNSAVIIVSGNVKTLGTILYANRHVREQLGFTISDLEGRNISRLMPAIIGEKHDAFMLRHYQTGESYVLGQERLMFIQTKDGLIEPVCISVKTLPSIEKGVRYVGFIRRDLPKIRNTYIKIPSQYKGKPLSFVLTDEGGNIIGISKKACSLFGLTPKYIMRKKGFTTQPFPVGKLAMELDSNATEKLLQSGMLLSLNISTVLDYLDYDYLNREEEQLVNAAVKEKKQCYCVMMKTTYQQILTIKIYAFINLSDNSLERKVSNGPSLKSGEHEENNNNNDSSEQKIRKPNHERNNSSGDKGEEFDSLKSSEMSPLKEKSKTISAQTGTKSSKFNDSLSQPTSVSRLKCIIIIFVLVSIFAMASDYAIYRICLDDAEDANSVIRYAHRRLVHFNIVVLKIITQLNIANGIEPKIQASLPDTDLYLTYLKSSQFQFERAVIGSYVANKENSAISPKVNVKKILLDFQTYTETNNLNSLMYELFGEAAQIIDNSGESTVYLRNFERVNSGQLMTTIERGMYFFLANILGDVHLKLSDSVNELHDAIKDGFLFRIDILFWIHIGAYSVIIIFAIMFVPILINIQRNKRQLLIGFAELSVSEVIKLSENCKDYAKNYLSDELKDKDADNVDGSDGSLSDDPKDTKDISGFVENVKKSSSGPYKLDDSMELENKNTKTDEEQTLQLITSERTQNEEDTIKERKKGIENVSVSLGYVSLVVCGIFIVVLGYYSKILWSLFENKNDVITTFDSLMTIHRRFTYFSSFYLYAQSYLKGLSKFAYLDSVGTPPYIVYLQRTLNNEDEVKRFKTYPSGVFQNIANILELYDSPKFCESIVPLLKNITQSQCGNIYNGILKEGLTKTLLLIMTKSRHKFITYSASKNAKQLVLADMKTPEFADQKEIVLNVFNYVFSDLEDQMFNTANKHLEKARSLITLDYSIMIIIFGSSFIVLFSYFVNTIEREIFTERGILAILPTNIVEKMKKSAEKKNENDQAQKSHELAVKKKTNKSSSSHKA